MSDEKKFSFDDNRGRRWTIRLTVGIVVPFTIERNITLKNFRPDLLAVGDFIELAWRGSRFNTRAEGQSKEDFLAGLDGPSFSACIDAAAEAVLDFFLRSQPAEQARILKQEIDAKIAGAAGSLRTSIDSGQSPASTDTN